MLHFIFLKQECIIKNRLQEIKIYVYIQILDIKINHFSQSGIMFLEAITLLLKYILLSALKVSLRRTVCDTRTAPLTRGTLILPRTSYPERTAGRT